MGNTVSKVVDIGLRTACYATGGLFGKSEEGYHLGPFRFSSEHFGINLNVGICSLGVKFGKNKFETKASFGIRRFAESSVSAGYDEKGCYSKLSGSVKVGPLKAGGRVDLDKDGIHSFTGQVEGPLLTNIKYSKEKQSVGALGVDVNDAGEVSFDGLKDAAAKKAGGKIREKYGQKKTEDKCKEDKQDDKSKEVKGGDKSKGDKRENKSSAREEVVREKKSRGLEKKGADKVTEREPLKLKTKSANGIKIQNLEKLIRGESLEVKTNSTSETRKIETISDQMAKRPERKNRSTTSSPATSATWMPQTYTDYCLYCSGPCRYK